MKRGEIRRLWRRLRTVTGAVMLGISLIWTAAMVTSVWYWVGYSGAGWSADIGDGTLYFNGLQPNRKVLSVGGEPYVAWSMRPNYAADPLMMSWQRGTWTWWAWGANYAASPGCKMYSVWPISVVSAAAGLFLIWPWVLKRRRGDRYCTACEYSLEGLEHSRACPECGEPLEAASG